MASTLRDTPLGQLIRLLSGGRFLQFRDDENGVEILKRLKSNPVDSIPIVHVSTEADPEVLAKRNTNAEDVIIVDWYSPKDHDNPRNFSTPKKLWTSVVVL